MKKKVLTMLTFLCALTMTAGLASCSILGGIGGGGGTTTPPASSSTPVGGSSSKPSGNSSSSKPAGNSSSSSSSKPVDSSSSSSNNDSSSSAEEVVTYELQNNGFNDVVVYKSELDYSGLTLKGSDGSTVAVTEEMLEGGATTSIGKKILTITYAEQTFRVNYTVKYKVEFIVDNQAFGTAQLVSKSSELTVPTAPAKEGLVFEAWQTADGKAVNFESLALKDNLTVYAKYEGVEIEIEEQATIAFDVKGVEAFEWDETVTLDYTVNANFEGYTVEVTPDNENVEMISEANPIIFETKKAGVTEITLTVKGTDGDVLNTTTKTVVIKPDSMIIQDTKAALGIGAQDLEGIRTIGRTDVNGNVSEYALPIYYGLAENLGDKFAESIVWTSTDARAKVVDGKVSLTSDANDDEELVTFMVKYMVNGVEYAKSNAITLRCVWDGVNVGKGTGEIDQVTGKEKTEGYEDLLKATQAGKRVVLNADIWNDFFKTTNFTTMNTTYDDTYYTNYNASPLEEGQTISKEIRMLLEFRNDLYGNGYQINAHNATLFLDDAGVPKVDENKQPVGIFKGPLNFVAMGNPMSGAISVKAQDNVCFALFEGVKVNNVELRGCDLTADAEGNYDLTDLDYVGTTVEVFGDNVEIEYSRLTNGRTVLRVFGAVDENKISTPEKEIHLNVSNCILQGAREFILRTGSNLFVKEDKKTGMVSPYLTGDNEATKAYNTKKSYQTMTDAEKKAYDEKYIKTFVNVKNSVFKDAGIFAIGMESHFAGVALHNPLDDKLVSQVLTTSAKYWQDLAKTSYGAKLSFEGKVRMYNWKPLAQIDSSTLITNQLGTGEWSDLTFDVKSMVAGIANDPQLGTIVTDYNNEQWVHAGLAFWGGGKNYSVFEYSSESEQLVGFEVSLDKVGQSMLKVAAGDEPFYFMICDENSAFTPAEQARILATGDGAYDFVFKK